MSLLTEVQADAAAAFQTIDSLRTPMTYHSTGPAVDPVNPNPAYPSVDYQIRGIMVAFRQLEIDGDVVQETDRRIIVSAPDLPGVVPKIADGFTVSGEEWYVVEIRREPSNSVYIFHCRRQGGG